MLISIKPLVSILVIAEYSEKSSDNVLSIIQMNNYRLQPKIHRFPAIF